MKMKILKKLAIVVTALGMTMSLAIPALAAPSNVQITCWDSFNMGDGSFLAAEIDNVLGKYEDELGWVYYADTATVRFLRDDGPAGYTRVEYWGEGSTLKDYYKLFDNMEFSTDVKTEGQAGTNVLPNGSSSVTLTKPGVYVLNYYEPIVNAEGNYDGVRIGGEPIIIRGTGAAAEPVNTDKKATKTASSVIVDGKQVAFDAYNIDGSNYFKLRDLAKVVSGTQKQFDVSWDDANKAINLISGSAYTAVGGELATGSAAAMKATANTSPIFKDKVAVKLTAYHINGNNYFKLRDIGQAFNFAVTWDAATNCINIDTAKDYQP